VTEYGGVAARACRVDQGLGSVLNLNIVDKAEQKLEHDVCDEVNG